MVDRCAAPLMTASPSASAKGSAKRIHRAGARVRRMRASYNDPGRAKMCERSAAAMHHTSVSDPWERGNALERCIGRWGRETAPVFLTWLNIPAGRRWLDVGCGTGALCSAVLDRCSPSSVVGVEPSEGFLETAKENLAGRVALHQASATAIPLAEASVDAVVSGLVLNFIPDPRAALLALARV